MSRFINIIRGNKKYFFVFLLSSFFSFPYLIDICSGYLKFGNLDLQEFLLWNYSALKGLLIYKDLFYPYGLLHYFRNTDLILIVASYMLSPFVFTLFYFIFTKIFREKFLQYVSIILLYVFIYKFIGFNEFTRYGLFVSLSLIFLYMFFSVKRIPPINLMGVGFITGLIFSFITDQALYLGASVIFAIVITSFLYARNNLYKSLMRFIHTTKFISFGFVIGAFPLLIHLTANNSFLEFVSYFTNVREITEAAKTPFFTFILSPANTIILISLFLSSFYLVVKHFLLKNKLNFSTFLQLSLIFNIFLLEQKSVVRSIDSLITFVAFILLFITFYDISENLRLKGSTINKLFILIFFPLVILVNFNDFSLQLSSKVFNQNIGAIVTNKCFTYNLQSYLADNPEYELVKKIIEKEPDFNGKVFSFSTGYSIYYILFNQIPPYFNAIFEGSSLDGQNKTISYINENKIKYVILKTDKSSFQDGVPDFIRQKYLFKYLVTNFYPYKRVGETVILKRNNKNDFLKSAVLKESISLKNDLLNVNLYKIPFSEGEYKFKNFKKNDLVNNYKNVNLVNSFLKENDLSSRNKAIILIPSTQQPTTFLHTIKIQTENNLETTINYNACNKGSPCIINLSSIPLFYKDRKIRKITTDIYFKGKISIFDTENNSNLW